jgi:hypothetical protein
MKDSTYSIFLKEAAKALPLWHRLHVQQDNQPYPIWVYDYTLTMLNSNADGHSSVNLLVKMLFWLSVSLKQVARMYLCRGNTVHYASLLIAVAHLPWKKNQVCPLFIWCNIMPVLSNVAFYTVHFVQWLKMSHLSFICLADICWNWKRLMYTGYRIYPVALLDSVSSYSQVIYFHRCI